MHWRIREPSGDHILTWSVLSTIGPIRRAIAEPSAGATAS
jgi:hypothetical protein